MRKKERNNGNVFYLKIEFANIQSFAYDSPHIHSHVLINLIDSARTDYESPAKLTANKHLTVLISKRLC